MRGSPQCLRTHRQGLAAPLTVRAAEILWGIWLLPLALLVYRSGFVPRFLGVWLAIGGFAYVILSLTGELLPEYQQKVFTYSQPAFFSELAFMLWLVIKGAKPPADTGQ